MSIQAEIEADLAGKLDGAIVGTGNTITGTTTQPKVEGKLRSASVYATVGQSTRLDFGQNDWTEAFAITVWWSKQSVDRDTRADEWAAFAEALRADATLGQAIAGVYDAYLSDTAWREASDSPWVTMQAVVLVSRIE